MQFGARRGRTVAWWAVEESDDVRAASGGLGPGPVLVLAVDARSVDNAKQSGILC
jgi:hypothetical protein